MSLRGANQRGVALVLVLWAGALMSVMAASFALSVRTELRLVTTTSAATRASALAEAGIARAVLGLASRDPDTQWQGDGREYVFEFGGGEVRVSAVAETGKIDINSAPRELLAGLVELAAGGSPGTELVEADHIADAIMDWRDRNDTRRLNGAEDRDYALAGLENGAGDRPFLSIEELQQVMGVEPALFAAMRPMVTVFSFSPRVDPLIASREVLLAVPGISEDRVTAFLTRRETEMVAAEEGGELRTVKRALLNEARRMAPRAARYMASARAAVYTLTAVGTLPDGGQAVRKVTIRLAGAKNRPYQVLAWRESGEVPARTPERTDS